jgi:hypothetical protein
MDTRQLALITPDELAARRDWRLDDHTREVGRQGIAAAREALRAARTHLVASEPATDESSGSRAA